MPTFAYQAMDSQGNEVEGTLRATGSDEAQQELRSLGYFVTRLQQTCPACGQKVAKSDLQCPDCGEFLTEGHAAAQDAAETAAVGASLPESLQNQVLALLRENRKIEAVKVYKEATGADLLTAKRTVESLGRQAGLDVSPKAGCGTTVLAIGIVIVMAVLRLALA